MYVSKAIFTFPPSLTLIFDLKIWSAC